MVVESCDLHSSVRKALHHPSDLLFGENEVAHHHHVVLADVVECRPAAQGETGLDFRAADGDMKVLARHVESDHASGQDVSGKSEYVTDAFPFDGAGGLLIHLGPCPGGRWQTDDRDDKRGKAAHDP